MTVSMFSGMNPRDIAASYEGTVVQLDSPDDDGLYPVKIVDVSRDNYNIVVRKVSGEHMNVPILDKRYKFSNKFPTLGMINVADHVCYVSRKAQRQWKKGLRLHNLSVKTFDTDLLHLLNEEANTDYRAYTDDLEFKLYDNKYTPYFEALESVNDGDKVARAISPDFCVSNRYNCSKPLLYYRSNIVGVVNNYTVTINEQLAHIIPILKRNIPNGYRSIYVETQQDVCTAS